MSIKFNKTVYVFTPDGDEVEYDVVAEFDYSAAERGSWEGGQQMEPDYPAECALISAKTEKGVCLMSSLDSDQIAMLEEWCLEEVDTPTEYEPDYEPDYDYIGPD
jgi:hypothetical protein